MYNYETYATKQSERADEIKKDAAEKGTKLWQRILEWWRENF